jgi:thiamine-monophosphate kinase
MGSERERIARLRSIHGEAEGVAIGIGDDAAVLGGSVLSVDAAIEDVHFRRAWIGRGASWRDVGRRAAIAALSDLAAMAARPRAMLSAIALPRGEEDEVLFAIAEGVAEAARAYGAPVIGGNLSAAREIGITTTVLGEAGPTSLRRAGAAPGDLVWLTGDLGAPALAVAALEAGRASEVAAFVRRLFHPRARIAEGLAAAAAGARAAIDVSDGLARDLGHLAEASGISAVVEIASLPLAPGLADAAASLGLDPVALALGGGEDYELLLTAPDSPALRAIARPIGRIEQGRGVRIVDANGAPISLGRTGHDHFG